jgi:hypothetical protein
MLKKTVFLSLLAATLFSVSCAAEDTAVIADKKFEIGVGLVGDIEGNTGDKLHSNGGLLLQGGYRFAPNWSVTGIYTYAPNVGITDSDQKTDIQRIIADLNYDFTPDKAYSPYLLAGAGYETMSNIQNRDGFLLGVGGGVRYCFTSAFDIDLSGMAKFDMDHTDQAVLVNVAVNYRY